MGLEILAECCPEPLSKPHRVYLKGNRVLLTTIDGSLGGSITDIQSIRSILKQLSSKGDESLKEDDNV